MGYRFVLFKQSQRSMYKGNLVKLRRPWELTQVQSIGMWRRELSFQELALDVSGDELSVQALLLGVSGRVIWGTRHVHCVQCHIEFGVLWRIDVSWQWWCNPHFGLYCTLSFVAMSKHAWWWVLTEEKQTELSELVWTCCMSGDGVGLTSQYFTCSGISVNT